MKKNTKKIVIFGMILSFGLVSCKKEILKDSSRTNGNQLTLTETTKAKFFDGKEINYTPSENETIIEFTKRFVNQTAFRDFSAKSNIYEMVDRNVAEGSWLFEAASNYLMNSNQLQSETDFVNFSILIDKNEVGGMRGDDLVNQFNAFISNLENYRASEGYKPKVIDIRIGEDVNDKIQLLANVSYGVEVANPSLNFPNFDVDPFRAADVYLTNALSYNVRSLNTSYVAIGGNSGTALPSGAVFLSSVVSYDNLWIDTDAIGNPFYYALASLLYPSSYFQTEHDLLYNSVLNYCTANNIPTNKLWSVFISPKTIIDQNSTTTLRHVLDQIKTADVNVM